MWKKAEQDSKYLHASGGTQALSKNIGHYQVLSRTPLITTLRAFYNDVTGVRDAFHNLPLSESLTNMFPANSRPIFLFCDVSAIARYIGCVRIYSVYDQSTHPPIGMRPRKEANRIIHPFITYGNVFRMVILKAFMFWVVASIAHIFKRTNQLSRHSWVSSRTYASTTLPTFKISGRYQACISALTSTFPHNMPTAVANICGSHSNKFFETVSGIVLGSSHMASLKSEVGRIPGRVIKSQRRSLREAVFS